MIFVRGLGGAILPQQGDLGGGGGAPNNKVEDSGGAPPPGQHYKKFVRGST